MDDVGFESFISSSGADILRYCRMSTGDVSEGDELYQDTLLMLWEKKDRLDPDKNLKSYAISTAINIWKNKKRKQAIRNRLAPATEYEDELINNTVADEGVFDPLEKIIEKDVSEIIRQKISLLPEKYRQIIYLYYCADMSTAEIARILRLSQNTVKTRMKRARERLKKELEESLYG